MIYKYEIIRINKLYLFPIFHHSPIHLLLQLVSYFKQQFLRFFMDYQLAQINVYN